MKFKLVTIFVLFLLITFNLYSINNKFDLYTQSKVQLSSLKGDINYLGRLSLWRLLVQNNDWDNAATLESELNYNQVENYKLSYQPKQLHNKLSQLKSQGLKTVDDYIQLAKIQSLLGQSLQVVDSIQKAHKIDPIRSDIERLFYQIKY